MLQKYDGFVRALVTIRKQDLDGDIIGSHHSNPLIDTCIYKDKFQGGSIRKYTAKLIAENIYSQTDPDVNEFLPLNGILDHRSTKKAVNSEYAFSVTTRSVSTRDDDRLGTISRVG